MILQGNVNGYLYPVVQQAYDAPIDATKRCAFCGRKFVAKGRGCHTYCSQACRVEAKRRQKIASYKRRKARA